jgi:purine-nucleoside phosphorylase
MSEEKRPNFMKLEVGMAAKKTVLTNAAAPDPEATTGEDTAPVGDRTMPVRRADLHLAGAGAVTLFDRAGISAQAVRAALGSPEARIGVILGSGLGHWADALEHPRHVEYDRIPGFPKATVAGHRGRLTWGSASGVPVFAMQGRFHAYEGYTQEEISFPVRVFGRLGVKLLVVTNAAGGVSERLAAGDLLVIEDHLNLTGGSPLAGPNDEHFGPRFPDMSEAYPARYRDALLAAGKAQAERIGRPVKSGVYAAMPGPSYETPAEVRMLRLLGADAVGMSTVPEVIVANHMGMGVAGISVIANMAAGIVKGHRLTHEEVVTSMQASALSFQALIEAALPALLAATIG